MARSKKLPVVLNNDEQLALLDQPNPRYPTGQRNHLILKIMLDTGLRASEATNLKWNHIDLMSGKLMVREGKGAKDRTLWLSEDDLELLQKWKKRQADEIDKKCSYIFTTLNGDPIQNRYLRKMVKRYSKKADIDKNVSPHTLRHTFATDLYRENKNIFLVQKALGHSDISTTMVYSHIVDEELENGFKSLNEGRNKRRMS